MISKSTLLSIVILLPAISCSQEIVSIPSIDFEKVVAFDSTYALNFLFDSIEGRYTPQRNDIKTAEELLFFFGVNGGLLKKGYRQYVGYVHRGQRFLLVNILNYKCKKQFKKEFQNWKEEYIIVFTEPDDEPFTFSYRINLDEKMIGF